MPSKSLKKQINRGMKTDFDSVVFYTTMTLVFFGIIMVFSASYIQSSFKHNDPYFFFKKRFNLCNTGVYRNDNSLQGRL